MLPDKHIERRIVIGLIVSDHYIKEMAGVWEPEYLQSSSAQRLASWCLEYYQKYDKAPGKDIEGIYFQKLKAKQLDNETAAEIEEDILPELSDEYDREQFNTAYLMDQTRQYFKERKLTIFAEQVKAITTSGDIDEAEKIASDYSPINEKLENDLDLNSIEAQSRICQAFSSSKTPVLKYPGALGALMNDQLVRGGFIGFQGPEKRGKCLPGSQKVLMSNGEELPIAEIIEKNRRDIITFDESSQQFIKSRISHFWKNGVKRVFQVTTRSGRRVEVTHNHPFLTPDGWKDLCDISVGTFIAVPKYTPVFGTAKLDREKIRLLAYFITDGCLVSKSVGFTTSYPDIRKDFMSCVYSMDCDAHWIGIEAQVTNSKKNRYKHNKNYVRTMLHKYGLMNHKSYTKMIPSIIFQLTKRNVALFLRTLFSCDGWVNKAPNGTDYQIGFGVTNEPLARQVQSLLTRFGIVSKINSSKSIDKLAWTVSIGDWENMKKFKKEIGFSFHKRKKLLKVFKNRKQSYRSFLDKFPYQIAQRFHDDVLFELEGETSIVTKCNSRTQIIPTFRKMFRKAPSVREQIAKKAPIMRQSFTEVKDTKTGEKYFNSQILWDEIETIRDMGMKETFDLTIPRTHNFVAENVLVHNSFILMDMAIRGTKQGANVVFFQAGDMTEDQMLRRICISIAQRSDKAKYCNEMLVPCLDCGRNFTNECERSERTGFRGVNEGGTAEGAFGFLWGKAKEGTLIDLVKENAGYEPCKLSRCPGFVGTVWYSIAPQCNPLTVDEAQATVLDFFRPKGKVVKRRRGSFKISTHVNGTLTVPKMRSTLKRWEQDDGFVPDIIIADYADLIEDPTSDFRHKQNQIWKGFRGLSQEYHALMVTATQADAASYEHDTISLKHFSEDKRKYSHVTAMYGLNQDTKGVEKKMKLMRINELLVREDEHDAGKQICVLQCLQKGLPIISSFNTFKVNE